MVTNAPPPGSRVRRIILVLLLGIPPVAGAQNLFVSPTGNDANPGSELLPWRTIQKACNSAPPGSTVFIRAGTYHEKVTVNVSGNALNGFVAFRNFGEETVIMDGTGIAGENMILLSGKDYVRISGLTLRNNTGVTDGSGVRIEGRADHIQLRNLTIHGMYGQNAMGITCYGTDANAAISNLLIDGNLIFDCQAAPSEALTLNGNVDGFAVTNNVVHDINNIGIDFIGGEGICPVGTRDRARNGICRGNLVYRARSIYGGGYAAGIYVDGGRNILLENNTIRESDIGIEIGCENHGEIAESVVVRTNLVYGNDKRGISFGGYNYPSTGQVRSCEFTNNTLFRNDVLSTGDGEFVVEYALNCRVRDNIVVSTGQNILLSSTVGSAAGNLFDNNLWYAPAGSTGGLFIWGGTLYTGLAAYRSATGQDAASLFGDPLLAFATLPVPDLHILPASPAVDAGWSGFSPDTSQHDMDGDPRVIGMRVDIGADELAAVPGAPVLLGPDDDASGLPPHIAFVWTPVPLASAYILQASGDSAFAAPVFEDSLDGDTAATVGPFSPSASFFWRVRAMNSVGAGEWSEVRRFGTTMFRIDTFSVSAGWNLVSLPLDVFNPMREAVYPSSFSAAFAFDPGTGYTPADSLRPGSGYWLKFPEAAGITVAGRPFTTDTIGLHTGWNIIGALSMPVDTGEVTTEPPGILRSPYFGYSGAYLPADSLLPSHAYWVKAASPGRVILRSDVMRRVRIHRAGHSNGGRDH